MKTCYLGFEPPPGLGEDLRSYNQAPPAAAVTEAAKLRHQTPVPYDEHGEVLITYDKTVLV